MGTTLDGKTLRVQELTDLKDSVGVQWDAWEDGQYKKRVKLYGAIQKFSLLSYEKGVAWIDSVVKHLKDKVGGEAVAFLSDQGTIIRSKVYVMSLINRIRPGEAPINYREFGIELQEKVPILFEEFSYDLVEGSVEGVGEINLMNDEIMIVGGVDLIG